MNTYLNFATAGDEEPQGNGFTDGTNLADHCYKELQAFGGPRLLPQLLIFLASPKYLENGRAHDLVPGIVTFFNRRMGTRVPLIGSSVAAVIFKQKVHECGAVLICLASKHLKVKVSAVGELTEKAEASIKALVADLKIGTEVETREGRPKLLLFLPNNVPGNPPSSFYENISKATGYRLMITGGVSYPVEDRDPGLQFTEFGVQRGAIVAARINFSVHVASGLGRSLKATGQYAHVKNWGGMPQIVPENGITIEKLVREKGFALLGRTFENRASAAIEISQGAKDIKVRKLAPVHENERLEILSTDRKKIREQAMKAITDPMERVHMNNPAGCIAFQCASCYRHWKDIGPDGEKISLDEENIGFDIEDVLREMEKPLDHAPLVGGFFAGEIGVDSSGHSLLANFAGAALTFGDDLQERFIRQRGFKAIAEASRNLSNADSVEGVIQASLAMLKESGYVGCKISMLLPEKRAEESGYWNVPKDAWGERFEKDKAATNDPKFKAEFLTENEVQSKVSQENLKCIFEAANQTDGGEGWKCEYVLPLMGNVQRVAAAKASDRKGTKVLGFLHVDLGKSRNKKKPGEAEEKVLAALAATVESALARVMLEEEAKIMRELDKAMNEQFKEAANERTQPRGQTQMQLRVDAGRDALVKVVVKELGAVTGYIRMRRGNDLEIITPVGPNCNLIREQRPKIDVTDKVLPARAFTQDENKVLNDASNDPTYKSYRRDWPAMEPYFAQGDSYAFAVLKDALGAKQGIIGIQAKPRWAFYEYHLECLKAFGERLRTVVNHLENRLKNSLPAQFLEQTCDKLTTVYVNNPDQALKQGLKQVVENFQKASAAHVVSLFLWEEGLDRFLLYAETGWKTSGWELAAYYDKYEGWTGNVAMEDRPRCEKDLDEYKKNMVGKPDDGRYKFDMYGSEEGLTESIGIPLKVGGKPLGVLLAFRRYPKDEKHEDKKQESFVTTDPGVLAQAADRITGYVSALLLHRSEQLNEDRENRYRAVNRTVSRDAGSQSGLEANLCRELLAQYQAEQVFFYNDVLHCIASASEAKEPPDTMVEKVGQGGRNLKPESIPVDESTRNTPGLALSHGLLRRVCIPLVTDKQLGVIDMRWREDVKRPDHVLRYGYENELSRIGKMISSLYQRHKMKLELEQAKSQAGSVETRSAYLADALVAPAKQALHRCNNLDSLLEGLQALVAAGSDPDKIKIRIDEIRFKTRQLPRAMRFLKEGVNPQRSVEQLKGLVEEAAKDLEWGEDVQCRLAIDPELEVEVNRAWIV